MVEIITEINLLLRTINAGACQGKKLKKKSTKQEMKRFSNTKKSHLKEFYAMISSLSAKSYKTKGNFGKITEII